MKRTSYFLLVLALLLTFVGCNQKEKKLQQIDLTHEQSSFVRDIMASALDLDDFLHTTAGYHHDTLVFGIVVDTLSEKEVEKMTKGEQLLKKYLLTALCCDSSPVKELFSQIAAVSAPIKLFYGDSSEEEIIMALNGTELRVALVKEYKQRDVLGNYFEWLSFYESDEILIRIHEIGASRYSVASIRSGIKPFTAASHYRSPPCIRVVQSG